MKMVKGSRKKGTTQNKIHRHRQEPCDDQGGRGMVGGGVEQGKGG